MMSCAHSLPVFHWESEDNRSLRVAIEMEIDFDLNDFATDFEDGVPVGDGKVYGSELITRITQGPQCP